VTKDKHIEMLENLIDMQNKMNDRLYEENYIAQKGILHIAKNTMQDQKWDNDDLHKYAYALDKEIQQVRKNVV